MEENLLCFDCFSPCYAIEECYICEPDISKGYCPKCRKCSSPRGNANKNIPFYDKTICSKCFKDILKKEEIYFCIDHDSLFSSEDENHLNCMIEDREKKVIRKVFRKFLIN